MDCFTIYLTAYPHGLLEPKTPVLPMTFQLTEWVIPTHTGFAVVADTPALLVPNLQDILSQESTLLVPCHWFGANQSNHKHNKGNQLHLSNKDKGKASLVDLVDNLVVDLVDSIQEVDLVDNIQVDFLELEDNIQVDNFQVLEDNILVELVDNTLVLEVNIQVELVDNTLELEVNIQEVPLEDNILLLVEPQVDNTLLLEVLLEVDTLNSLNNPNNLLMYLLPLLLLHHLNLSPLLKMLSKMLDMPNVVKAATLLGITKKVKKLNSSKGSLVNILSELLEAGLLTKMNGLGWLCS